MRIQSLIFDPELTTRITETGQERLKAFVELGASAQEAAIALQKMGAGMVTGERINAAPYIPPFNTTPRFDACPIKQMFMISAPKLSAKDFDSCFIKWFEMHQWKRSKGKQARYVKVSVRTVL